MTTATATTAQRPATTVVVDERPPLRELDARTTDGITVRLLWRPGDPGVLLQVDDARTGVRFELDVPGHDARLAFHHPFAYAGSAPRPEPSEPRSGGPTRRARPEAPARPPAP